MNSMNMLMVLIQIVANPVLKKSSKLYTKWPKSAYESTGQLGKNKEWKQKPKNIDNKCFIL